MAIEGVQLKIKFPQHLYDRLERDSADAGVPIASVVRMAVAAWYKPRAGVAALREAYAAGAVTDAEFARRLTVLDERELAAVS